MSKSKEVEAFVWACRDPSGVLSPFKFSRRHEIVGIVTEVGKNVQKVKVGDKVGVGCLVGSCRKYEGCANNLENYCPEQLLTDSPPNVDGIIIHGGFSDHMVADEHFVLRWPDNLPLDSGAPLLGAGITMYSPLSGWEYHWWDERDQKMLDFAAKHNITADVEVISMDYVNTAMERLQKGDVRYRFVLDVANTLQAS